MVKNTNVDNLTKDFVDLLTKYTDDVKEATNDEVIAVGEKGASQLREVRMPMATSSGLPPAIAVKDRRSWSKYSKGWKATNDERLNYTSSTIHNRTQPHLVHLLEYGHATHDGKRTRSFAHVKPVEDKCEKQLLDNVKKIIEKGGKL